MSTSLISTSTISVTAKNQGGYRLSRRELLTKGLALGSSFLAGNGFLAASNASWAMELKALDPTAMATLVQMARDIYPHDRFSDDLYAMAVKSHDEKAAADDNFKAMIEAGVKELNTRAQARQHPSYIGVGWEAERVNILKSIEQSEFFQTLRSGLVVGLYNQKAVWDHLGYEGSSFEKGGYLDRGFDDINWL